MGGFVSGTMADLRGGLHRVCKRNDGGFEGRVLVVRFAVRVCKL